MIEYRRIAVADPLYREELELRACVFDEPEPRPSVSDKSEREKGGYHFIALSAGHVVGCLGLYPLSGKQLEVRHVAVDVRRRREGVAAGLFAYAEAWARREKFDTIVLDGLNTAVGFYRSRGFAPVSGKFIKHGEPHQKFSKSLGE